MHPQMIMIDTDNYELRVKQMCCICNVRNLVLCRTHLRWVLSSPVDPLTTQREAHM